LAAMETKIIDGKKIAEQVQDELRAQVTELKAKGITPGVGVVLVGSRADSSTYVRMKKRAAEGVGMAFRLVELPDTVTTEDVLAEVEKLNKDPAIHGFLVQLPLPSQVHEKTVLDAVSFEKDVDGFHPLNTGNLAQKGRDPLFVPCTPFGCIELLKRSGVEMKGKNAVVLGRSNIVGLPMALCLMNENATVTVCHSQTTDIPAHTRNADILVAAIGKPKYVTGDMIKEGAVVIDVGIHSIEDATTKSGKRLVGDVDADSCKGKAAAITPVPGGVGPMTVTMLLAAVVRSAARQAK